jgi:16S rRNA (cytosine1402-N4)-methyltransferase
MHKPVLLNEVLEILQPKDGETYIDATFGAGGYTKAILKSANCKVHAIDQDESVEKFYHEIKQNFPDRIFFHNIKFSNMANAISEQGGIDGIVFDLGVSTMQLKTPERGFSFNEDGPLDMRMSDNVSITADMIVNSFYEEKIADILYKCGDEYKSRRIARAIVRERQKKEIRTTTELANIIRSCFPRKYHRIDPATKSFQALRIFVNDELQELENGIRNASTLIKRGGKIITVSFHSLEDRIVKEEFKALQLTGNFQILNKKVIKPTEAEINENLSARSSRLRSIIRI